LQQPDKGMHGFALIHQCQYNIACSKEFCMSSTPDNTGDVTAVAIEMEPGWMFFKINGPKPEPSRIEFFLRRAIEDWLAMRPTLVVTKTTAITNHGEMLGIHVWYTVADNRPDTAKTSGPVEFGIDVHGQIASKHSREYVEAVITDALKILPGYEHRRDTLVVVNPRRLAVLLDKHTNRGVVIPVGLIEQVIDGGMKERLRAWLAAPPTPFYVMHIAGSWFAS
jgi:hypothetical protein